MGYETECLCLTTITNSLHWHCCFCAPQILYYSNDVFRAAGVPHPDVATVGTVGVVLVLITFVVVSKTKSMTFEPPVVTSEPSLPSVVCRWC